MYRLAGIYVGIVLAATLAIGIIIVDGKFFITLSQRSNVETLTLAVILLLFGYLTILSLPGAWGALKIVYYNVPAWLGRDQAAVEARKQAVLKPKRGKADAVYLNRVVRQQGQPDAPIAIPLQDQADSMGEIVIDGVKMSHERGVERSSNSIFAYFEQRIQQLVYTHDPQAEVQIVQWATINGQPLMMNRHCRTKALSRSVATSKSTSAQARYGLLRN